MSARLEELSSQEAIALVSPGGVGRLALCTASGPQIYPITYAFHDGSVVFRTATYTMLGTQVRDHQKVAFEVDELDHDTRTGWSVVVAGMLAVVDDPDEVTRLREAVNLEPWAAGSRQLLVRIEPYSVTGRRVVN